MKRILISIISIFIFGWMSYGQELLVDNGSITTSATGKLIIDGGDLIGNSGFNGTVVLKNGLLNKSNNLNMNLAGRTFPGPYIIYNLEIDNPNGVNLSGGVVIENQLKFTTGNIFLNNANLAFRNGAGAPGGFSDNKGVVTNGNGYCEYELLPGNLTEGFVFPIGYVDSAAIIRPYPTRPAPIYLFNTGGSLSTGTPKLRAQVRYGRSPNSPSRVESYTNAYWPIRVSGINGGNLTGTGYYGYTPNAAIPDFVGTETDIVGFGYNNQDWLLTGNGQDPSGNSVTGTINTTSGQIFGMNKFVYLKAKALLQGAYAGGGLMNDDLRSGIGGNLIPLEDPYRTAPYNALFAHVNNAVPEVANAAVFADQTNANDNIVDWVFIEIRDAAITGSNLLQTRSALIQRDGDIVDIDGKSQLYFKHLNDDNYTITIRHRNHLSMSTNNAGNQFVRLSNLSFLNVFDFTTATASRLLGTGGNASNNNYNITGGLKMLFGGNANAVLNSKRISFSGAANDVAYILGPVLNGASNVLGNNNGVYHWADVNMDRRVSYSGNNSDPGFILSKSLAGFTGSIRNEIKPQ